MYVYVSCLLLTPVRVANASHQTCKCQCTDSSSIPEGPAQEWEKSGSNMTSPPQNKMLLLQQSLITVRCVEWVRIGYAASHKIPPPRPPRQDKLLPSPCSYLATSSLNLIINLKQVSSILKWNVKRMGVDLPCWCFRTSLLRRSWHQLPTSTPTHSPKVQVQLVWWHSFKASYGNTSWIKRYEKT